jgi:hypothetical protein
VDKTATVDNWKEFYLTVARPLSEIFAKPYTTASAKRFGVMNDWDLDENVLPPFLQDIHRLPVIPLGSPVFCI